MMREDLSFEPIERGFNLRERVTSAYEVDLRVRVARAVDGQITIHQHNVTHGVSDATIPLTDEQARIMIAARRSVTMEELVAAHSPSSLAQPEKAA